MKVLITFFGIGKLYDSGMGMTTLASKYLNKDCMKHISVFSFLAIPGNMPPEKFVKEISLLLGFELLIVGHSVIHVPESGGHKVCYQDINGVVSSSQQEEANSKNC